MIKYLQLRKTFDTAGMKADLLQLNKSFWSDHYNKAHYSGDWTVLPLRSIGGRTDNAVAVHASLAQEHLTYKDTALLERCGYIREVLDYFNCEKTSVRLMKMSAGSMIKEHSDLELSYEQGEVRIHIPIQTNEHVHFMLENERIMMHEGECWYLNLSLKHSVSNQGQEDRIHLVIDCKVNDWIKEVFENETLQQKDFEPETSNRYTKEEQYSIIAQLRTMNTPTSIELADKMEKDLQ